MLEKKFIHPGGDGPGRRARARRARKIWVLLALAVCGFVGCRHNARCSLRKKIRDDLWSLRHRHVKGMWHPIPGKISARACAAATAEMHRANQREISLLRGGEARKFRTPRIFEAVIIPRLGPRANPPTLWVDWLENGFRVIGVYIKAKSGRIGVFPVFAGYWAKKTRVAYSCQLGRLSAVEVHWSREFGGLRRLPHWIAICIRPSDVLHPFKVGLILKDWKFLPPIRGRLLFRRQVHEAQRHLRGGGKRR